MENKIGGTLKVHTLEGAVRISFALLRPDTVVARKPVFSVPTLMDCLITDRRQVSVLEVSLPNR